MIAEVVGTMIGLAIALALLAAAGINFVNWALGPPEATSALAWAVPLVGSAYMVGAAMVSVVT